MAPTDRQSKPLESFAVAISHPALVLLNMHYLMGYALNQKRDRLDFISTYGNFISAGLMLIGPAMCVPIAVHTDNKINVVWIRKAPPPERQSGQQQPIGRLHHVWGDVHDPASERAVLAWLKTLTGGVHLVGVGAHRTLNAGSGISGGRS